MYPICSSISAEPDFELTDLFPCFAILTPQLAATKEAAVDIFKVLDISPPVPQVSTVLSGDEIFIDFERIIFAAPNISFLDSPLSLRAIKIAEISISLNLPFIINSKSSTDSLTVKSCCAKSLFLIVLISIID